MKEQIKRTDKIKRTINLFIRDKVRLRRNESRSSKSKESKSNSEE